MDPATLTLRATRPADLAAVDALVARAFPAGLRGHYPPSVMVLAVPRLARASAGLVGSGGHFGLWQGARLLGVAGFGVARDGMAQVRQVATDPHALRLGLGRRLVDHVLSRARAEGAGVAVVQATRNAVPFYAALGFEGVGERVATLAPGIDFPFVAMRRGL